MGTIYLYIYRFAIIAQILTSRWSSSEMWQQIPTPQLQVTLFVIHVVHDRRCSPQAVGSLMPGGPQVLSSGQQMSVPEQWLASEHSTDNQKGGGGERAWLMWISVLKLSLDILLASDKPRNAYRECVPDASLLTYTRRRPLQRRSSTLPRLVGRMEQP